MADNGAMEQWGWSTSKHGEDHLQGGYTLTGWTAGELANTLDLHQEYRSFVGFVGEITTIRTNVDIGIMVQIGVIITIFAKFVG